MKIKNSKRLILLCALPFVLVVLGILAYNHFELYHYKNLYKSLYKEGILKEFLFAKLAQQKCEFNPLVAQGGGDSKNPNLSVNSKSFIAHAGGAIIYNNEVFTYTNSKEALLQSIKEGFKFIELDLMLDDEGAIFAAHDYEHFYKITNAPNTQNTQVAPSKDYLSKSQIYGYFTPLNSKTINEIFMQNPSLYLVTDKLNDFNALATQFEFKDRLLIEVFSTKDYFKARKMGFKYPMFCVWGSFDSLALAMKLKIPMVTAHTSLLQSKQGEQLAQEYIQNGGCIMMFSSNEKEFIDKHKGKSATMFYTDFYDIKADRCKLDEKECKTY